MITDLKVCGKKVIMRVDFNVPLRDGTIIDNTRILAALPSIEYLLKNKAALILMSHLGRPKGKKVSSMSLLPCREELAKLLGKEVKMAPDCIGKKVEKMISDLKTGEILMLENVRFYKAEDDKKNPEARKTFAKKLAALADIYVNDAFGTAHREHASTANIAEFLPSAAGFLIEKELRFLGQAIENPQRPLVAILGGAKISDKIPMISQLLTKADKIIVGGGMAYTFYKAMGLEIGNSLVNNNLIEKCKSFLEKDMDKIVLPLDNRTTLDFDFKTMELKTELVNCDRDKIPADKKGLDIGEKSIQLFKEILLNAKTILWNGPMGVFECKDTAKGTLAIAKILAQATANGATTIVGGGDSVSAIKKAKLTDKMTHISTGGGSSLEFLEGKALPGIVALQDK